MQNFFLIWLFVAWIAYFLIHSILASNVFKAFVARQLATSPRYYRLAFNLISTLLIIPIAWLLHGTDWQPLWQWTGTWQWIMNGVAVFAIVSFLISLRAYSGMDFSGLGRAFSGNNSNHKESFRISRFHRFVRHPWYFLALLLIWSRDMNSGMLLSALLITLYFFAGSYLEEKKLKHQFGSAYTEYCQKVSGLIPLPWKTITTQQAQALETQCEEYLRETKSDS